MNSELSRLVAAAGRVAAKSHLKNYGWSYRSAAPELGVSFEHLCRVLNRQRISRRLVKKVFQLKRRPQ